MVVTGFGKHAATSAPDDGGPKHRRTMVLQVKAEVSALSPLHLVAADLAARADFDLDTVQDLQLAVDEAAAELVALAAADAVLKCTFRLDVAQMEVTSSVPAKPGSILQQDSFGWRVLTTLVDEVRVTHEPDPDTPVMSITLLKRRRNETAAKRR